MSLPESYKYFCLNYFMSKGSYFLAELLKEIQAAEGIICHAKSAQVAEKGSSSSTKKNKKKKKAPKSSGVLKQKSKKDEQSLITSASHVVSVVIRRKIVPSLKLELKTTNL